MNQNLLTIALAVNRVFPDAQVMPHIPLLQTSQDVSQVIDVSVPGGTYRLEVLDDALGVFNLSQLGSLDGTFLLRTDEMEPVTLLDCLNELYRQAKAYLDATAGH